jgi:N-acetylmuramoyl-L-alanine amidase
MAENLILIQKCLQILGHDPGPVDGVMGKQTRLAIRSFQKERGLQVDGIVGPVTLGALMASKAWPNDIKLQPDTFKPPEPPVKRGSRPVYMLVWHCTATKEGQEFTRAQIKAMHIARGFNDIGYHLLIHLDGSTSVGRSENVDGAHVSGFNANTLGYSYVGGVDKNGKPKDTRTAAQKATMLRVTKEVVARYRSTLRTITGHRDLSPDKDKDGVVEPFEWLKVCPCFAVGPEYGPLLAKRKSIRRKARRKSGDC